MNCREILSHLNAYLDNELSAGRRQETEEHLRACRACSAHLAGLRQAGQMLESLTVPPVPATLATRIMAGARQRAAMKNRAETHRGAARQPLQWLAALPIPLRLTAGAMIPLVFVLGLSMSREVYRAGSRQANTVGDSLEGVEWFSPLPPDSLGDTYQRVVFIPDEGGAQP
jgi:anti-sigma factor RsiW